MSGLKSTQIPCKTCSKIFSVFPSRLNRRKYCSKSCRPTVPLLSCTECGKINKGIRFSRVGQKSRFCSKKCDLDYSRKSWERIFSSIDRSNPDSCWEWPIISSKDKYGRHRRNLKNQLTHRISYEVNVGEIPEGLFVLHKCDNPPCCNPSHLFLGTHTDNMRDASKKNRLWQQQPGAGEKMKAIFKTRKRKPRPGL